MSIPHFLNIYEKPKQGNSFLVRKQAFGYQHTICAMGWFDTANCQLAVTQKEGELAFENWVGNRVAFFAKNAAQPIWEGLINRVTFEAGGVTFTRSIDEMTNRAKVTWRDTATPATTQTTAVNNTESQAIYGIKEGSIDGLSEQGTGTGRAVAIGDLAIALQAWPLSSMQEGGGANILRVEMIGFYQTLDWESFRNTSNTAESPFTYISTTVLPNVANGATFFNNADLSLIEANADFTTPERSNTGETLWQQIQKYTEPGDGVTRYIAGIAPTQFGTNNRALYYRAANTDIEYTARIRDGMRIRNKYGGIVPPYMVRPDRGLRLTDALVGWNGNGLDPRELYILNVSYDAERQIASVQGYDDTRDKAIFQLNRLYKRIGTPFGAPIKPNN